MGWLEQRLRPSATAKPWQREVASAGLIIALTTILLKTQQVDPQRYFSDVVGQMFSFYLLTSMAFAFALRWGAIDLSPWACSALGGVTAASMLRIGCGLWTCLLVAMLVGLAVGALHGLFVGRWRWPSPLVTGFSAGIIVLLLSLGFDGQILAVPAEASAGWVSATGLSPLTQRIYLVAGLYLAVLAALGVIYLTLPHRHGCFHRPAKGLFVSLAVSGALSSLAGAVWLIEHDASPIPQNILGDLRIPAAAILAGGLFLIGRGRILVILLCLPATVLAATIWRLEILHLPWQGHLLVLMVMTLSIHVTLAFIARHCFDRLPSSPSILRSVSALSLSVGALLLLACSSGFERCTVRRWSVGIALGAWVMGLLLLAVLRFEKPCRT